MEADRDVYDAVLAVDLLGVIHGTKAFLPHLIASGDGHVVNTSRVSGYTGQPTLPAVQRLDRSTCRSSPACTAHAAVTWPASSGTVCSSPGSRCRLLVCARSGSRVPAQPLVVTPPPRVEVRVVMAGTPREP